MVSKTSGCFESEKEILMNMVGGMAGYEYIYFGKGEFWRLQVIPL